MRPAAKVFRQISDPNDIGFLGPHLRQRSYRSDELFWRHFRSLDRERDSYHRWTVGTCLVLLSCTCMALAWYSIQFHFIRRYSVPLGWHRALTRDYRLSLPKQKGREVNLNFLFIHTVCISPCEISSCENTRGDDILLSICLHGKRLKMSTNTSPSTRIFSTEFFCSFRRTVNTVNVFTEVDQIKSWSELIALRGESLSEVYFFLTYEIQTMNEPNNEGH